MFELSWYRNAGTRITERDVVPSSGAAAHVEGTVLGKQCQILSAMSNNTKKTSGIQTRPLKACVSQLKPYFEYNLMKNRL